MGCVPSDEEPLRQTRFVDQPPDRELVELLSALRRQPDAHETPPFEEPDWLPFFASINVLHCRHLRGPADCIVHLVVGDDRSRSRRSVAAVFAEAGDQLCLCFGPASATQIALGSLVSSA